MSWAHQGHPGFTVQGLGIEKMEPTKVILTFYELNSLKSAWLSAIYGLDPSGCLGKDKIQKSRMCSTGFM